MPVARDEAEGHFETYLGARGLTFEYEQPAGDARPDFWVNGPAGLVVCEVRHVTARIGGPDGNAFGSFDPYKPIAKAVKRKARQGRGLDGAHPYVVVLWAPGWGVDDFTMSGALFGKLELTMPLDPATGTADMDHLHTEFGRDAALHDTERDHISAVVVIRRFNPTLRAAQDEISSILDETDSGRDDIATGMKVMFDVFERRRSEGVFDEDARQPRLTTFHNPTAATPLGFDVFNGPFDQQWSHDSGRYRCTNVGDRVIELPD